MGVSMALKPFRTTFGGIVCFRCFQECDPLVPTEKRSPANKIRLVFSATGTFDYAVLPISLWRRSASLLN